ncbi:MAG: SDR family oxidoreductase [Suipraeoptans sp.]
MKGKIVVITGGGSGLGAKLAKRYSEQGATVVILGRTEERLGEVVRLLTEKGYYYVLDVSDLQEVRRIFNLIYRDIGIIDILVNSAGVGVFDWAENTEEEAVHAMIDTNLKGTIFCTQAVLLKMKKENKGNIINIISMSGKRPVVKESVYCASKYGVTGFTQAIALELADTAVRVTGIYMGNMATELWGEEKPDDYLCFIDPEDMTDVIMNVTKYRDYMSVEEVLIKNHRN